VAGIWYLEYEKAGPISEPCRHAGKMLRLYTLRYADEVIPVGSLELEDVPLSEKELKIGSELIEKLTAPLSRRSSKRTSEEAAGDDREKGPGRKDCDPGSQALETDGIRPAA